MDDSVEKEKMRIRDTLEPSPSSESSENSDKSEQSRELPTVAEPSEDDTIRQLKQTEKDTQKRESKKELLFMYVFYGLS